MIAQQSGGLPTPDQHYHPAPAAHLGDFKAERTLPKPVSQMALPEKLAAAMWQAKDYVGPEAKALIDQLTTPEAIGQLVLIEVVYGISLFFGVGEIVTGLIIIAGVIFVGEVVIDILKSLTDFVSTAKNATTQAQLTVAAHHFAHALTLGLAIVSALLLRKAVRASPLQTTMQPRPGMTIIRRGNSGGGKKKPKYMLEAENPTMVKKQKEKYEQNLRHDPPDDLPAYPEAKPRKPKNQRQRWVDKKGRIYEWDYENGRVEIYTENGKTHIGEFDANTGEMTKPPKPGRKTNPE